MALLTLLVVACITFFLMNAIPGNPWLSEKTPSQATIDALNAKYGLDQPLIVQLGSTWGTCAGGLRGVDQNAEEPPGPGHHPGDVPGFGEGGHRGHLLGGGGRGARWAAWPPISGGLGWTAFCGWCAPSASQCRLRGGDDHAHYAVRLDRGAQDFPDDL